MCAFLYVCWLVWFVEPGPGSAIHTNNQGRANPVPLLGLAIGDGWSQPDVQTQAYIPHARALGLIDEQQAAEAQVQANLCSQAVQAGNFSGANRPCLAVMDVIQNAAGAQLDVEDVRKWNTRVPSMPIGDWLNQPAVMKALFANHAWGALSACPPASVCVCACHCGSERSGSGGGGGDGFFFFAFGFV
jgi:hypothetical protein